MFMPITQGGHHFDPAAIVTFTASAQNGADNLTSATFSSQALGAADPTRQIVVVVGAVQSATTGRSVTSLTVGGTSMSEIHTNNTQYSFVSFWSCEKATGTSGDVVINFNGTMGQSVDCAVYALYNAATSEYAKTKASGVSASLANTISIPAEGVCISHTEHNDDPTRSTSWTNLTERYDVLYDTNSTSSGASDAFATAQTDRVITATYSSTPDAAGMVTVSWAKA
tara:strand:- start:125 stop:802 length:678 start_codon:yes stop_codon:yes gene_type:complete